MGNSKQAVSNLRTILNDKDRTYAWLSRETGIPYKRLLAELKNSTRPITLETAVASTEALGADLQEVLGRAA